MGNRANFGFKTNGHTLYLYGHWAGENMLGNLANALEVARPRWTDPSYATRITVSQMIGDDWNQELGWGLTVDELCDNEHKVPVVDFDKGTVTLLDREMKKVVFSEFLPQFVERYAKASLKPPIDTIPLF